MEEGLTNPGTVKEAP